jgi:hypothetical protein
MHSATRGPFVFGEKNVLTDLTRRLKKKKANSRSNASWIPCLKDWQDGTLTAKERDERNKKKTSSA